MGGVAPMRITRILDLAEHLGRGEPPDFSYREIEPASRSEAPAPAFIFGPTTPGLARQFFGQAHLRPVGCFCFRDASVAPTGVVLKGAVAFSSRLTHHPHAHVVKVVDRIRSGELAHRHVDGPLVPLFGPAHDTYGHVIVDYLPRLWVLARAGYDLAQLRFLVPQGLDASSRALLHGAGITPGQCVSYAYGSEIITTDHLIVPTIMRTNERLSHHFAEATRFWADRLRSTAPSPRRQTPARVFLSRRRLQGTRLLTNRAAIETLAERAGFAIVSPETLSVPEQIALFEGATHIVGEYGSALHNSVFAKPGTITLALRGTLGDPGCIQTGLGDCLGQSTGYVLGRTEGEDRNQRFSIDEGDFSRAIEAVELVG